MAGSAVVGHGWIDGFALNTVLERLRHRLAIAEAIPQLALLGVLAGFSTGVVMVMFRAVVELPLMAFLPGHTSENFEGLSAGLRFGLVSGGALVLGLCAQRLDAQRLPVGVVHVMERLHVAHGRLPVANAIVQFVGGAIALITGQSGGREGPAIHLGAAASSWLGVVLDLPHNSIRTLVACGTAAAIAGSFNTPLAGVIFAMEVVMMEYSIASFAPVILAAITSALVNQAVFGDRMAFMVPAGIEVRSLIEYPFLLIEGLFVGCIASGFLAAMSRLARVAIDAPLTRFAAAGLVTGGVAVLIPQVMGIGYDTVARALQGQVALGTLVAILSGKLLVSAVTYALRMPVGIIGPMLVIGACAGGALGATVQLLAPDLASFTAIYVILGMGAMMGAVLQAPLSALIAVVELTGTPNITLPAMLAIVVATLVTSALFKQRSVFLAALEARGLSYPASPVALHMRRTSVTSAMHTDFTRLSESVAPEILVGTLRSTARWIVVDDTSPPSVLSLEKLRQLIDENGYPQQQTAGASVDLEAFPAARLASTSIDSRATLYEAWELLNDPGLEALCVRGPGGNKSAPTLGVLTRADVVELARFDR